jgi:hypothetical protein
MLAISRSSFGTNLIVGLDDGDLAAKPPKHLPEFKADVAAADDEQVLRQFGQLQDTAVGQEGDFIYAWIWVIPGR